MTVPMLAAEIEAGLTEVKYMTIPNVEIARVGMKWPCASGLSTLTLEHLADAVMAANDDPFILAPRLKIGHDDPRFNEDPIVWDPFAYHGFVRDDGNPAYGKITNLRLTNDGAVMVGDYVDVPDWLANAAPSAYPSRSQEADWDIVTPGGKRYSMVVTAVALLGEKLPAIATLKDLVGLFTAGFNPSTAVTARRNDMPIAAAADVDAVVHQCWYDFCVGERIWWWPCSVWVDPNQVILDDDEGHLYRVEFTTDDDGTVTFGDPVPVVQQFRDVPDKEPVAAARPVASFSSAALAGRPSDRVRPVAASVPTEGVTSMNEEQKKLALSLGLGEDATVEQLNEKLQTDALAKAEPTEPTEPAVESDEPAAVEEPAAVAEPVAAGAETVTVSKQVWEQTNDRLGKLEATNASRDEAESKKRKDKAVGDAIAAGRIAAVEHDHYRGLMDVDEEQTTKLLTTLAAGRIPVRERGVAPSPTAASDAATGWFAGREIHRPKETV